MSDRFKLIAFPLLALIVGIIIGYHVGHWQGVDDGKMFQKAKQDITATKETVKAGKQRDKVDDETRKIPDTALDAELHALGVLRD